jgi:hypothetical protein
MGLLIICRRCEIMFWDLGLGSRRSGKAVLVDPRTQEVHPVTFDGIFQFIDVNYNSYMNHKAAACEVETRRFRTYSLPWNNTTMAVIAVLEALNASSHVLPPPPFLLHPSADRTWHDMLYHVGSNSLMLALGINSKFKMSERPTPYVVA